MNWAKIFGACTRAGAEKLQRMLPVEKVKNLDDGKQANLRVTYDVLWNWKHAQMTKCVQSTLRGVLASISQ